MRILIAGGGTGGHTSPASAIIEELRHRDPRVELLWVGKAGAIEERVAAGVGVHFRPIPAVGWPRAARAQQLAAAAKFLLATFPASRVVHSFKPNAVVGVGGYVSLPPLLAAQYMGVPTFIHEQNRRLGMANRILARKARRIFLSYENSIGSYPRERAVVTGNPVRAAFAEPPEREAAKQKLGMPVEFPLVLVVGGSQGAQSVNAAVGKLLQSPAPQNARMLWMTGAHSIESAKTAAATSPWQVEVATFIDDMATACAAADVIVSRAGASSTAEIAAVARASILIPYPFATDDHQTRNAEVFVEAGAAVLIADKDCQARLPQVLTELLTDASRRGDMERAAATLSWPHAAQSIVDGILREIGTA